MGYAEFYRRSIDDRDAFWAEQARLIEWKQPPQTICDYSHPPFTRWFAGGTTNLCHNAVDRHLKDRPDQPALIYVSSETGAERTYSFRELHGEVQRAAAALKELGVQKGDRVLIYMPMIAEAAFAMLACARIGAIHCVVFGGFASVSLASRIEDATPKVIVSADAGSRGGKVVAYKPLLDEAIRLSSHKPESVLLVDRGLAPMEREAGRDHDWAELTQRHSRRRGGMRVAGFHRHQLHDLHQRHDRQAQGRAARRWRLRRGARRQHEAHLPGRAGRNLFLHQRHRLGGGPQLHRLRPPDRGHGDHHVRRPADPPGCRRLVEPGRKVQGHAPCSARRRRCACSRSRIRRS